MTVLAAGLTNTIQRLVAEDVTAHAMGSGGVRVLGTPALLLFMEEAAFGCVGPALEAGQTTVGTSVELKHLAATPVGLTVTVTATLAEVDGRRLVFEIEAHDGVEVVGRCRHERFIVNLDRFVARAVEKAPAG